MLGGENQRGSVIHDMDYSEKAQCTGNPGSYLEPISNSMHVPIEGVYSAAEKIEDRSRIGCRVNQKHCRRFMKREGVSNREQQSTAKPKQKPQKHRKAHTTLHSNTRQP